MNTIYYIFIKLRTNYILALEITSISSTTMQNVEEKTKRISIYLIRIEIHANFMCTKLMS